MIISTDKPQSRAEGCRVKLYSRIHTNTIHLQTPQYNRLIRTQWIGILINRNSDLFAPFDRSYCSFTHCFLLDHKTAQKNHPKTFSSELTWVSVVSTHFPKLSVSLLSECCTTSELSDDLCIITHTHTLNNSPTLPNGIDSSRVSQFNESTRWFIWLPKIR